MSTLLDHPIPTLPPPPPPQRDRLSRLVPRWSRRTWKVLAVVGGALFVFSVWLFYFSSVFALESLVIEGVRTVSPQEIGQRADLGAGTPLARVNADDVEARVMGIAGVQSVNVSRRWPHVIVISIVERARVATLQEGDRWAVLDAQGFAFELSKKKPQGLPVVDAAEGPARTAAIEVASSLPESLATKVKVVTADSPDNVRLTMSSGETVVWGSVDQSELKARIVQALLLKTKDKWIDVRQPNAPSSAQSSPVPAPPPPSPTPSGTFGPESIVEGDQVPGGEIPTIEGVAPATLAASPTPLLP